MTLSSNVAWIGPILVYLALAAGSAGLAWRLRQRREAGKSAKVSMGATHS